MAINTEQENFIDNQSDIILDNIVNESSQKTNLFILDNNNNRLNIWNLKIRDYIRYLRSLIDTEQIIGDVVSQLNSVKPMVFVDKTTNIGQIKTHVSNGITYNIERKTIKQIEITQENVSNWATDNLIIQVKNENSIVVYPLISTANNKITIDFEDGIALNYFVILL